jgi:hypothetical protein
MSTLISRDYSPAVLEVEATSGITRAFAGVRILLAAMAEGRAAQQTYDRSRGRGHEAAMKETVEKHFR